MGLSCSKLTKCCTSTQNECSDCPPGNNIENNGHVNNLPINDCPADSIYVDNRIVKKSVRFHT